MSIFSIFNKNKQTVNLKIEGLHCEHCVMKAKKALEGLSYVKKADVKLPNSAVVTLNSDVTDFSELLSVLSEAGYSAEIIDK